jgi:hypothetical protein
MEEVVLRAVGISECEQLPVGDVELARAVVDSTNDSLEHVRLAGFATALPRRPAVLTDPNRHVGVDTDQRQRLISELRSRESTALSSSSSSYRGPNTSGYMSMPA